METLPAYRRSINRAIACELSNGFCFSHSVNKEAFHVAEIKGLAQLLLSYFVHKVPVKLATMLGQQMN